MEMYNLKMLVIFILLPICLISSQNIPVKDNSNSTEPEPPAPPVIPGLPAVPANGTTEVTTIDSLITPSDQCKEIVAKFASAISNFTECSVTNSRPIHLCGWCISYYLKVKKAYHDFFVTIDEKGNPCKEYFTNLDRIEIVSSAYNYVQNLWNKGKCDYCFLKYENGTIMPRVTEDVVNFDERYEITKSCFNAHINANDTCIACKEEYDDLNRFYIDIVVKYGDNVCLDMVDTMNTTREIWSEIFHCFPIRGDELWLHIGMGVVGLIPVVFYFLAYFLSTKQEARVYHQRRLAEVFSATSHSEGSEYLSSRHLGSTTSTSLRTSEHFPANSPQSNEPTT